MHITYGDNDNDLDKKIINYYDENAKTLTTQYESVSSKEVFGSTASLIPSKPSFILDVGSGSGRDAAWLAKLGHIVTAVEPSRGMRELAMRNHGHKPIKWVDDRLPYLSRVDRPVGGFEFILVSAVWMHLTPRERAASLARLRTLVASGGSILISLRHGTSDPSRPMLSIDTASEIYQAHLAGFKLIKLWEPHKDQLGRGDVRWELLHLSLKAG